MSNAGPYKTSERHQTYWSSDGKNYRKRRHAAYTWPIILALLIIASMLVMLFIFYTYDDENATGTTNGIPLVEATHTLVKKVPKNPGGEEVPHQDKLIFTTIDTVKPASALGADYQEEIIRKAPEIPIDVDLLAIDAPCTKEPITAATEKISDTQNTLSAENTSPASKPNTPQEKAQENTDAKEGISTSTEDSTFEERNLNTKVSVPHAEKKGDTEEKTPSPVENIQPILKKKIKSL